MMTTWFIKNTREIWDIFLGFFVHFVLLLAVFDIYYKSPLIHGVTPRGNFPNAPASRLVVFIADGLRAETFYDETTKSPFLKQIRFNGSWGVAHTRVPTESRPGHVAIFAGFYEDVSAVTRGWSENPVEFDTVFNQSVKSWAWGSPDILPMFAKGATGNHVTINTYLQAVQDFASEDPTKLDSWVFSCVRDFINTAKHNLTLKKELKSEKIVLFLHLLATDVIGHGAKPTSRQYPDSAAHVDSGIKEIYELLEEFYEWDEKTAYVFTSDHGMTDWGSHGSGNLHETETPFVVWGAGVARQRSMSKFEIEQIDLAPFLSALIGINMPKNSIGKLPIRLLEASDQYKALVSCANFDTTADQMLIQRENKLYNSYKFLFRDFPRLSIAKLSSIRRQINKLLTQRRFTLATNVCLEWISPAIDGLLYFHRYERRFLTIFAVLTFLFYQFYIYLTKICINFDPESEKMSSMTTKTSFFGRKISIAFLICIIFYLKTTRQPIKNYVYCLTPCFLLYKNMEFLDHPKNLHMFRRNFLTWSTFLAMFLTILIVEFFVLTFEYRFFLTIFLIILSIYTIFTKSSYLDTDLKRIFGLICILNSIFPLLPTVGQSVSYITVCFTAFGVASFILYSIRHNIDSNDKSVQFYLLISLSIFCASFVSLITAVSIANKQGSPFICRLISWALLIGCPLTPFYFTDRRRSKSRFAAVVLSFFPPFILMSSSYEPLFYILFVGLLYIWIYFETSRDHIQSDLCYLIIDFFGSRDFYYDLNVLATKNDKNVSRDHLKKALFLIFFVLLAFFGTGNLASLNSYDPSLISCFVTVFSPYLMTCLLLIKICIPIFLVCFTLRILESISIGHDLIRVVFWLIVLISDFMALNFFFLLKDEGSWLDIGSSISHYVISMSLSIVIMLLYRLAKLFTNFEFSFNNNYNYNRRHSSKSNFIIRG